MRADRLISLLMLLQSRGRMSARRLAKELEVSERTILRDIDALSLSGVPVVANRGPEGGFELLDSYQTQLTGLTDAEKRALFLVSIPSALADLGLDDALASALRKTTAAITGPRSDAERMRERIYLDTRPWRAQELPAPHLERLRDAALHDRRAHIHYRLPSGPVVVQLVRVYGLVAAEGQWHLVYVPEIVTPRSWALDQVQALPLSQIETVEVSSESFVRRRDFNLMQAWYHWRAKTGGSRFELTLLVVSTFVPLLPRYGITPVFTGRLHEDAEGWVRMQGSCASFEEARARVLALGRAVEVVAPEPLRQSIIDYAEQILGRYATPRPPRPDLPRA